MSYNLILLCIMINIPLVVYSEKISKFFNVFDSSDGQRKFQKKPIPLIGGFIIYINFIFFLIINNFYNLEILDERFFQTNRELFSLIFGSFSFFFFGFLDDKYNFNANIKLFSVFIITLIIVMIDENLLVSNLKFESFSHIIELKNFSYFFTILCFLLFINALNMFDGINLQVGSYSILVLFIFSLKLVFLNFNLILIVALLFFLYLNYKNKAYLGESGVQLLGFIISYIVIKSYNFELGLFYIEEIFIIMALPGLDLFRLFCIRLLKGKHPFKGDMQHLHHLLMKKFDQKVTFFLIISFISITIISYDYIQYKFLFIFFYVLAYSSIIFYLKKRK